MEAARHLVHEHGFDNVTMHMISDAAGVGRQTVYRRWPTKADLIMDALLSHAERIAIPIKGHVTDVLSQFLIELFHGLQHDGPAIRSLIAAAQKDPVFLDHFNQKFVQPRDRALATILEHGVANGELPEDADIAMAVELIHGSFWYRLLLGRTLDERYARTLSRHAVASIDGLPRT
jgi:AcrR family transcriptional regulator